MLRLKRKSPSDRVKMKKSDGTLMVILGTDFSLLL